MIELKHMQENIYFSDIFLEPLTSTAYDEDQEHSSRSIYEPAGQHFDYHERSLV